VTETLPSVTIIIPARPDQAEIKAVTAARQLDYPADRLEIIVARGKQPSVQRNTAIRAATGDLIYFLDDDSVPERGNLRRAVAQFSDPSVKMVGGPNLCPPDAPALERVFAVVLSSWLAFGPSRARYARAGLARESGEKELILCNLLARRDSVLELGGFNDALYPIEENARPRHSLAAFFKMLRTYGRGRAEQFRLHPTLGSAPNFVPPAFCIYLAALLVFAMIPLREFAWLKLIAAAPLALYGLAILLQTAASIPCHGPVRSILAMPLLVASHVLYGYGFLRGLFTKLHTGEAAARPRIEVVLETVKI
jgi:glycosyltransferase involved in cell wall biosynthesis